MWQGASPLPRGICVRPITALFGNTMPNILLVEDDAALSELIASYLERNGYHVSVLSRGDHVRERARLNPPDLVILDLMLPG
ncbi:response regulator, partial [Salmonella enterica]|uniref:response regulator n=1 Tax=Salmonella enterica TaxID=28901 RepID=UPI00391F7B48